MGLLPCDEVKRRIYQYILEGQMRADEVLPTINQLAAMFGVSPKTVQKAIHALRAEGVIQSKRGVGVFVKPVELRRSRGRRIGILFSNTPHYLEAQPYPGPVIAALRGELEKEGLALVPYCIGPRNRMALKEALAKCSFSALALFEIDNDAVIFELRQLRLPMISIDYDAYRHGISSVVFDNGYGTFQATKHLIQLGHRKIAFVRPLMRNPISNYQSLEAVEESRRAGYAMAMQDAGLSVDVYEFENQPQAWHETAVDLLLRNRRTAVVCPADGWAEAVIRNVEELGAKVPDDLSAIGFGDIKREYRPGRRVSSVKVDYAGMGLVAARLLAEAMQKQEGRAARREIIPATLALYDSIAAPKESLELAAVPKGEIR
jgi:DNA-binding LacI/PurR family transcriptional regulator